MPSLTLTWPEKCSDTTPGALKLAPKFVGPYQILRKIRPLDMK